MVKTHKNSRFALLSLESIRDSRDVILQVEDTGTVFNGGGKCYLCEIVTPVSYGQVRSEAELIQEICKLNDERRGLLRKISRLEKELQKERDKWPEDAKKP